MTIQANRSTTVVIDGHEFLYFGGTNYLGLAHHPALQQAASRAFEQYGFSTGASRITSGQNELLLELETELAALAGAEETALLGAGFLSNLALVEAVDHSVDYWLIDERAHGSIKVAAAHSRKPVIRYQKLPSTSFHQEFRLPDQCILGIFAEPVDALSGALLDVKALVEHSSVNDFVILDEAHSFGVLGRGAGALRHFGLPRTGRLITTGTLSKAVGTAGGFVAGSAQVITAIRQRSSCYKGGTPVSPVICAASLESLELIRKQPDSTVERLRSNVEHLNAALVQIGLEPLALNLVPIYSFDHSPAIARLREALPQNGIYVPSTGSYFGAQCPIALRWTIQAGHRAEDLDKLVSVITLALS
jgi:8-amino-7-oxononanoate synthase